MWTWPQLRLDTQTAVMAKCLLRARMPGSLLMAPCKRWKQRQSWQQCSGLLSDNMSTLTHSCQLLKIIWLLLHAHEKTLFIFICWDVTRAKLIFTYFICTSPFHRNHLVCFNPFTPLSFDTWSKIYGWTVSRSNCDAGQYEYIFDKACFLCSCAK